MTTEEIRGVERALELGLTLEMRLADKLNYYEAAQIHRLLGRGTETYGTKSDGICLLVTPLVKPYPNDSEAMALLRRAMDNVPRDILWNAWIEETAKLLEGAK